MVCCINLPQFSGEPMVNPTLTIRIASSLAALGICWFVSGVATGLYIWDVRGTFLFFFWSLPFFVVGWTLVGIPIIVMGDQILRIPKALLGVAGATAGAMVMVLPTLVLWAISLGTQHFRLDWAYLKGWPAFGAGIGAAGVILYGWLLSRAVYRKTPNLNID
jgi:hypothetical protein